MGTIKTTRIVIETRELWVIRRLPLDAQASCADCDDQFTMVTVDQAVGIARLSARAIYGMVESDQIHFMETADGLLMVCLNSLASSSRTELQPR